MYQYISDTISPLSKNNLLAEFLLYIENYICYFDEIGYYLIYFAAVINDN